ncbi:NACHT, LRR and PYD domains-containing protein 12-like, partial [Acanthaster planci]|uniref:NACHT, LRR and PYD domains-containing protein 12-like n=1 Tax=Acanthaster planci TaxID=133434 RepID=A0A8B7YSB0_ACAPL
MVLKTIQELNEYVEATGVVYNHSNTKLISRKSKVKRSRREAFLSLLPYRRLSSHHHHAENKPFTKQKSKSKPIAESATSKTRQKLQVSVRSQLPHGSKTLDFEVDPDTSVSSLKELIHRRIGVLPQRQHLHIGNIPLLDFLTLHENGVDKKKIISLSTDDLTPDGPKVTCQSRDEAERTQAQKPDETRSEKEQSGATPQEEEKMGKTKAHDKEETPIIWCIKGYLQVFVKNPLLRGPRMLCFQLEPETSISSLKEKIHERIGVKPKLQHLHIRRNTRNFQLHDLLTLNDCGVQQDETIVLCLPTGGLLGGGRTDPNDVAKQDTNKKQTDGNRVNPPSDSQETPRQGEQQSTRSETQDFSVKSSSQHKRTAQEQDSQQGTSSKRARQGEAGKLDDSSLYSLSEQISAKKWTKLAIKLGFCHAEVTHFEAEHPSDVVRRFFDMLVSWRNRQSGDVNQTEALCKALKEVGETRLADNLAERSTSDVQSQVATKCKDALKERYECTGAYVPLNPWLGKHKKHFVEIYTRLQLAKARDREKLMQGLESLTESTSKDRVVSYEDILLLKTETGKLIQIAVLSGLAGRGKTTLLDKIALDWATGCSQVLQKYELVFLLKMCYLEQVSSLIDAVFGQFLFAEGAFKDTEKDALMSYIQENADKVLFLLDGFDELKTISLSNPILKILNRKLFRGCTVLVSTRPSHFDRLVSKELVQEPYTHVRVLGFNTEDMRDYVKRYYSDEPDKAEGLLEKIQSSNNFSTLAESPMLLLLMCLLWREDSTLPETMSQLYQRAIKYIGKRKDISKEEMSRVLIALGQVSLCGLLSQDQELTFQESGFEQSVLDTALKVGIVTRQTVFKSKSLEPHSIVQFIHKTFQEFSAAAYLRNISKADTKTFHDTVNEIMSKDPLAFGYLLRFCCGDNEACTLEILKVFQERHQKDLSFISEVGQLALHCYFEGQCKCLPPEEFIHSFLTDHIAIQNLNDDSGNSVRYFVQRIAKETRDSGRAYLADVKSVIISSDSVHVSHIVEAFSGLPNLVTLELYGCRLCGTAVSWGKQLRQCKALQELDLRWCFLNGQDMVHVAESLSGLPNLHTLDLIHSDLGGTAVSLVKQLGQCKALQHLGLSDCSLNGKKMVHVAESLSGLPYLVTLKLSWNDLGGKAALWGKQLGQCKTLQDLDLSGCKLNGQDMVHVAESLSGLPYLVTLKLSWNDLGGKAALWCKQLGQCKALRDLDLSGCKLNGQDMVHVAESLNSLPNLVRLRLIKNDLGGVAALFCAELKQFKALEYLMLGDREVTEKEKRHI